MSGGASDRTRRGPRPANSGPAGSVGLPRRPSEAMPVAGAPGWYVIRSTAPIPSSDPMRWSRHFRLATVGLTVGLVALLLVLSMIRAQLSEAPAGPTVVLSRPPLVISPVPSARSPSQNAPIEKPSRPPAALQTQPDPVLPDELGLLPVESIQTLERATAERESYARAVAAAPSATASQSTIGRSASRAREPRREPVRPRGSLQQVAADPAILRSGAKLRLTSQASRPTKHSRRPAGDIRIFIHHVAGQGDSALAQRLADYLRGQGFTVADIRAVDVSVDTRSVRYFFTGDRAASQRLVEQLGQFSKKGKSFAPDHASDFTHFVPKPRPGSVEVWLPAS
jgi:hypothetical protein